MLPNNFCFWRWMPFVITLFNLLDAVYIQIFELSIIFCNWDKFYQYFGPATIISIVVNPITTRNVTILYYTPDIPVDCLLVIFGLVFKVYFDGFSKKQVFDVIMGISLKYIGTNSPIVFVIYEDLWKGWTCDVGEICKKIIKKFLI